ncbi:hypothetical protein ACX9NE_28985, partial [Mycobacterium sp. ML4]
MDRSGSVLFGSDGRIDPSSPSLDHVAAHALPTCAFDLAQAQDLPVVDLSFDLDDLVVSGVTR